MKTLLSARKHSSTVYGKIHPARIVVVGSSNTDLVVQCDHLPRPGETLLGGEFTRFAGGKGANQAVAAARAGACVTFVGARGTDDFGRVAADGLLAEGIDIRYFRSDKKSPSGVALILVGGATRENLIAVARSANDSVSAADVKRAAAAFRNAGAVVTQLEIPLEAVLETARQALAHNVPFVLNPAPARSLPSSLLRMVHTLVPNEHEAALLSGETSPRKAATRLLRQGCNFVVITLGAKGALLATPDGQRIIPAPRVKPVDTVGAGDCFTAWLAVGIAEGLSMTESVQRATRASAVAVTRQGAQAGMPHRRDVI
jgi:ribokinase